MIMRSSYHPFRRPRRWFHYLFWIFGAVALFLGYYQISHSREWAQTKLDREGYTQVTLTGWEPLTIWCGSREGIAQGFRGRDARGEQRTGYVCSNLLVSYIVD
jgi:hypothetical protein